MQYKYFCEKCQVTYDVENCSNRFCEKCGSYLTKKHIINRYVPFKLPSEKEKIQIAKYVVQVYEEDRKESGDLEISLLESLDVETVNGRFEVIMLATLFSLWAMREERAYAIWKNLISWIRKRETDYSKVFLDQSKTQILEKLLIKVRAPPKFLSNIIATAKNLDKVNGDLNGLILESSWRKTIQRIMNNCVGVNQKAFWITRVMKQKKAWDVPGRYCCVSDSHNKAFLLKTGFIRSDKDLFYNSEIMWKYFNKPFKNHWYDLPVFRFAKEKGCKKCRETICDFDTLRKCPR